MTDVIGIAGAGNLGMAIARKLREAGTPVLLLTPSNGATVRHDGFELVASVAELAERSSVVLTCLRTGEETEALLPQLLAGAAGKSAYLHIDHGNGVPEVAHVCAAAWAKQGHSFADAPLLGPPESLANGKARLLVGADAESLERLAEVSSPYCDDIVHAGAVGQGHRLRQVLNLMGYGLVALSASAIAAAKAGGIAPDVLRDAARGKGLDSETFQTVLASAIDPALPHRPLSVSYIRGEFDKMRAALPQVGGADLLAATLSDFYALMDSGEGDRVMATALPARLEALASRGNA